MKQIEALIKGGESVSLEFKTSTTQLKSALETLCAFSNRKGGLVLIGVKNDGELVGQVVTDNTRQEIAREIKKLDPPTEIDVNYLPVGQGKFVITLEVISHQNSRIA